MFSAPAALPLYAHAFERAGALGRLEAFASHNGADFYGLPRNAGTVRASAAGVVVVVAGSPAAWRGAWQTLL
jgi:dihydroorotase